MYQAAFLQAVVAALVTGLLLWRCLPYAGWLGLLDCPGGRKDHAAPTPNIGGFVMTAGAVAAILLLGSADRALASLFLGGVLLMVVGALDDFLDIRWYWRVLAQAAAALIIVYWGGVRVDHIGPIVGTSSLELGALAVPFTVLGTIGVINAINMSDGADGVAGSLGMVSLLMLASAALYAGNSELFMQLAPMLGAISGFLVFNIRSRWVKRARVFMGNSGSAVLGLAIAWVAFRLTQNHAHPVSPVLAPWLLAPPLIDCLVLMMRRLKMGSSPFQADRNHMHHLLLAAGFTPTQVALGLGGLSGLLGLGAALSVTGTRGYEGSLVIAFLFLTLGYYWLTSRRVRAVGAFMRLRALGTASPLPTGSMANDKK